MTKREKVIKGIEHCIGDHKIDNCVDCPYDGECAVRLYALEEDTIALLREQNGDWISVKERLPELGVSVLVAFKVKYRFGSTTAVETAMLQNFGFCGGGYDNFRTAEICETEVTHWMPLPKPPKEGTNDG